MATTVVLDGNLAIGFDGNTTRGNPSSTHSTRVLLDAHHSGNRSSTHSTSVLLDAHHGPRKLRSSRTPPRRLLDAHHGPRKLRNRPQKLRSSRTRRCRLLDAHPGPQKLRNRPRKLRRVAYYPGWLHTGKQRLTKRGFYAFTRAHRVLPNIFGGHFVGMNICPTKLKMVLHL